MTKTHVESCPPDAIASVVQAINTDAGAGLVEVDRLISEHPLDARLHFLRGSLLAGAQRYEEGAVAMNEAVVLAPTYHIARYQLGFLQFTSGDTVSAAVTWAPLQSLGLNAPLALFAQGLQLLTQDRIDEAIGIFEDGMARNTEVPPINHDIALLVEGLRKLRLEGGASAPPEGGSGQTSAAQMLLQRYGAKDTKH